MLYCSRYLFLVHKWPRHWNSKSSKVVVTNYFNSRTFASHCTGRRLSTWQIIAASCPTALGTLCNQLTFWLTWCREHSSYSNRTIAAAGPHLWNSLLVQLHNPNITYRLFRWQQKGHLSREAWTRCFVISDMWHFRKTLTYLHVLINEYLYVQKCAVRKHSCCTAKCCGSEICC